MMCETDVIVIYRQNIVDHIICIYILLMDRKYAFTESCFWMCDGSV